MKRFAAFALGASLAACAAPGGGPGTVTTLTAADAATALITGERIEMVERVSASGQGQDPLVSMTLKHADGRALTFQQANHTPNDVMAQAPGGPLANIMGLFGEEAPVLYTATAAENSGAPFICGPEGPAAVGIHQNADGTAQVVGLKQSIEFETRPDGVVEALPFSPDMVCARLRFRRN